MHKFVFVGHAPLTLDKSRVFQVSKYAVYALLTFNIYVFFAEEWAATAFRFVAGVALNDVIEGFAASIDTAAWVVLLLMFELETYVLEDRHITRRVAWALHGLRAVCYAFIVYAFYGYLTKLIFLLGSNALVGSGDLCTLAQAAWAYAIDLDEYVALTADNCRTLSNSTDLIAFTGMHTVVDQTGFTEIIRLAWVDIINSAVWLLVVMFLEVDVRLQERQIMTSTLHQISKTSKFVLYGTLLCAAIYWGFKGDFIDFWDAFLWLVAFACIELNVFEWRQETGASGQSVAQPAI